MPYVNEITRQRTQPIVNAIRKYFEGTAKEPGDLNYIITQATLEFLGEHPCYASINAVIGALECAKLELYRRMAAPYEDKKIDENGDVYPFREYT